MNATAPLLVLILLLGSTALLADTGASKPELPAELQAAEVVYRREGPEAAQAEFKRLAEVYEDSGEARARATAVRFIGEIHWRMGEYEAADQLTYVRHFDGDKVRFERRFGILDEDGYLVTDLKVLAEYGLLQERIEKKGNYMPPHPNNFAMGREIFWMLGGYDENKMELSYPKCTDDGAFKGRWAAARDKGLVKDSDTRPILYMFPSGQFCSKTDVDYIPFGFFHNLTRKTDTNIYHRKAKRRENLPN